MGLIQNAVRKWKERKEDMKDYEMQRKFKEKVEMKDLSSDERELMRFQKEEREKQIKAALQEYRKKRNDSVWSGKEGNPIYAPNTVTGQKELFKGGQNLFMGSPSLFGESNLFFKK